MLSALCLLLLIGRLPLPAQTAADLLQAGDAAASAGQQVRARDLYERAARAGVSLTQDAARARYLGFAYMDFEPHDFAKAAQWLQATVTLRPDDNEARLALANVLAWDAQYDAALTQYRSLAERQPGHRDTEVRIARTLSWARRFSEAIAAYDKLIAATPGDNSLKVERARVLSWAGRYQQSERGYDEVLRQEPGNFEARVGQAQILYWSGRTDQAYTRLQNLVGERPRDEAANLTLAAIEHNMGNDDQALHRLSLLPLNRDTRELKAAIDSGRRPVLDLRFGFGDDREHDASGPRSTYRTLRYTSSIAFALPHGLRLELWNTVVQNGTSTPVLAQFGPAALSGETLARLGVQVAPWLSLRVAAGEGRAWDGIGTSGAVRHAFLYELHPTITRGGLRLDLSSTRRLAPYTPLAVRDGLVIQRMDADGNYTWRRRFRAGAEFWHADYSLQGSGSVPYAAAADGGALSLVPILLQHDRVTFEAGMRYELFRFDSGAEHIEQALGSSGVFMPRFYQRYAGTANLTWNPRRWAALGLRGSFGPQRVFFFAALNPAPARFGNTGTLGGDITFKRGKWSPYVSVDYFGTATPGAPGLRDGQFHSTQLILGVRRRF